jgi:hypothetical protein
VETVLGDCQQCAERPQNVPRSIWCLDTVICQHCDKKLGKSDQELAAGLLSGEERRSDCFA